ncbi:Replication initiation factor [compost metagenome]
MEDNKHESLISLIDWLGVTLKTQNVRQVMELIGIPETEFIEMPRGLHGYHSQLACGDIRILHEGKADMGIHVQFSGQGCRQWENYWGASWEQLLENLYHAGANFSRLDLAVDDIRYNDEEPYFRVPDIISRAKNGTCRSKFRKGRREESFSLGDGSSDGDTIYFGRSSSDLQVRIYEKNYERKNEGFDLHDNLTAWNRVELQLRDQRALDAVELILKGNESGNIIFGLLSNYINFCDPNGDSNKSRWPISQFWLDFLNDAEKLKLAKKAPDKTIPRKQAWLNNQVLPTLAEVWWATGSGGSEYFVDMINEGLEKMTEAQWFRANQFREMVEVELAHKLAASQDRYEKQLELREHQILEFRDKLASNYRDQEKRDVAASQFSLHH